MDSDNHSNRTYFGLYKDLESVDDAMQRITNVWGVRLVMLQVKDYISYKQYI